MIEQVLVSIIIPCYQAEKTVSQTLEDIFKQTYKNIEIIAVDDGSTDSTGRILQKYHNQIKIIKTENQGASAARNKGFSESNGGYILFCDADVKLKNDMIEKMLATLLNNPDKAYCYSNFKFGPHTFDLFEFNPERLKEENYISTMSLIVRNKFIGFDEKLNRFQDWDLWKRMLDKGYEGIWHPERLFEAPLNSQGISKLNLRNIYRLFKRKIIG